MNKLFNLKFLIALLLFNFAITVSNGLIPPVSQARAFVDALGFEYGGPEHETIYSLLHRIRITKVLIVHGPVIFYLACYMFSLARNGSAGNKK